MQIIRVMLTLRFYLVKLISEHIDYIKRSNHKTKPK